MKPTKYIKTQPGEPPNQHTNQQTIQMNESIKQINQQMSQTIRKEQQITANNKINKVN